MKRSTKRAVALGGVVGASALIATAAVAWACVALSSLTLTPARGGPGAEIKGSGTNFWNQGRTSSDQSKYGDVVIRWGGADSKVILATVKPYAQNTSSQTNITFQFKVPEGVAPGTYPITATQTDPSGGPAWGTPARVTFTVPGKGAAGVPTEATASPETIRVNQQHIAAANAARAGHSQHVAAPAPAQPGEVPSLEAQDAIDAKVTPSGSRSARFSPASTTRAGSSGLPMKAGLGLVAVGLMALLTAVGAAMVLRSAQTASARR